MCGRYVLALRAGEIADALDAEVPEPQRLPASHNIAPTSTVPILVERFDDDGARSRRELHAARWGLLPRWAPDIGFSSKTFNARSETVTSKPSFRSAVRRRRCAVPAQGYYEWRVERDAETGCLRRRPFYIHPADGSLILFAGLYEWWQDPATADHEASWVLSTTILTDASPAPDDAAPGEILSQLAELHDRLPLALDEAALTDWLDPQPWDAALAETRVAGLRASGLRCAAGWRMHEVDPAVGHVRNEGPGLIEPVSRLF